MDSLKKNFDKFYTGDNKLKFLDQRYLPRWIVVILDTVIAAVSMVLVYFILESTPITFHDTLTVVQQGMIILLITISMFFLFKTYSGIIRHSTFIDVLKLAFMLFSTAAAVLLFNFIYFQSQGVKIFLTTSVVLYGLLTFTLLLFFRVAVKESYLFLRKSSSADAKKKVAIFGITDNTIALAQALSQEWNLSYQFQGFLTDELSSKRYKILGKPVVPIQKNITKAIEKLNIEAVLLVNGTMPATNQLLTETLVENGIDVFNVPNVGEWDNPEKLRDNIKPIQIEDLLERAPITIESDLIKKHLQNKTILVTGGAGSIGSEIVRQVANFSPKQIVILDQSEYALYQLELSLREEFPKLNFITELADISNMYRLELLFEKYDFDVVYHAAAYKHVPLIERNPHEAVYVNIMGTVNLSIVSAKSGVSKFVMVSTDKAVNPTNVMGASKRAAEMYVQALQNEPGINTRFIVTRFGNVLGSSGSVIPLFRKQIAAGGPVTVTHKDIIRYFMTIPEACQLVLQAGTMGNGGEIYVFDMGKPIKIYALAERMIRLSGYTPNIDIPIKITGLRPGEKLYEELLNDTATTQSTHHPKITIAKDEAGNFHEIKNMIKKIITASTTDQDVSFIRLLKELVPEYKSENSQFEKLDISISHRKSDSHDKK